MPHFEFNPPLGELESDVTITLASGTIIKYKFKRASAGSEPTIEETITLPDGSTLETETSVNDIFRDSAIVHKVGVYFEVLRATE